MLPRAKFPHNTRAARGKRSTEKEKQISPNLNTLSRCRADGNRKRTYLFGEYSHFHLDYILKTVPAPWRLPSKQPHFVFPRHYFTRDEYRKRRQATTKNQFHLHFFIIISFFNHMCQYIFEYVPSGLFLFFFFSCCEYERTAYMMDKWVYVLMMMTVLTGVSLIRIITFA